MRGCSMTSQPEPHDAWWVIHSSVLLDALKRAAAGEDPDLLYVELIANSDSGRQN